MAKCRLSPGFETLVPRFFLRERRQALRRASTLSRRGGTDTPAIANLPQPDRDGYVLAIKHIRIERRAGKEFDRTIGIYQVFFNRAPIANISGIAVDRQPPGDNS